MANVKNQLKDTVINAEIVQIGNECTATLKSSKLNNPIENDINRLKLALKRINNGLVLPKLSWLDEGKDFLFEEFYMELQLLKDKEKKLISINEIFDSFTSSNRLLIESKPGYGKTTLCIKLLYDWAKDVPYTDQFDLAFLVQLNNLLVEGIEKSLASIIPDCGIDKNSLEKIIYEAGGKVLILLDGFDELTESNKQSILEVMCGKKYGEATVVLTSRHAQFNVNKEDWREILGISSFKTEFPTVIITGIKEGEVINFIQSLRPDFKGDIKRSKTVADNNWELFKCPLFVIMFTFVASMKVDIEKLNTKTKLYRSLFDCIIRSSLSRGKEKVTDEFNIFDIHEKSSQLYQEILHEFGDDIIKNLMEFKLQFEVSSMTEKVYNLGFLVQHKNVSNFSTTSHFEAIHKSILEFIAAYSIWRKCLLLDFKLTPEIIQTLVCIFMHQKNAEILQFFFGLCENKLPLFISYIKSYVGLYWNVEEVVWNLTTYNKLSVNQLKEFCNVMPAHCDGSSKTVEELKLLVDTHQVKKICIFAGDITPLPKVQIPELRLIVGNAKGNLSFSHLQGVSCLNFVLDFQFECINSNLFQTCLQTVNLVNSDRNIIINLNSETIEKLPNNFNVTGVKIDRIECTISGKRKNEFTCVTNFAKVCSADAVKLEILENKFSSLNNSINIISLLPTTDYVFMIKNGEEIIFNVRDVALQERINWYKTLGKGVVTPAKPYTKINYLNVNSPKQDLLLSILNLTLVYQLRCFSEQLSVALDALPSEWPGYTHLNELSLLLCNNQRVGLWEKIKNFKNLKSMELQMMWKPEYINHIDSILDCICSLPLTNLSFHLEVNDDIVFITAFISKFKEICNRKDFSCALEVINIVSIQNYGCLLVPELLECLRLRLLQKVHLLVNPNVWADVMRKTAVLKIDYSVFQIAHKEHTKNSNTNVSEIAELPIAFRRPSDNTIKVSYIQMEFKK